MCSRSSSKGPELAVALAAASLLAGGCQTSVAPGSSLAPPQPVFVDRLALQSRHPLAAELDQLRAARGVSVALGTSEQSWEGTLAGTLESGLESGPLRGNARTRLASELVQAEAKLAEARARRRARRLEQRRAELLASERAALAEQERLLQEKTDQSTRNALEARVDTLSHLKTAEQIYRAQLRDGVLGPANPELTEEEIQRLRPLIGTPPTDAASLKESVNRLKGPTDFLPAPRSRMTVMAEAAGGAARRVKSEMDSLWEAGLREREDVVKQARAEMEARVEERLKLLASQRPRNTQNRSAIRQELAETLLIEQQLAAKRVMGTAPKRVAYTPPSARGASAVAASRAALLERLLAEDVRARVADAAQRQRLALREVKTPGVPDRTSQIGGWVGLAEGREKRQ